MRALDFDDVMIVPQYSTVASRDDVDLITSFSFKYADHKWSGVPIIAANMYNIGTLEVAKILNSYSMLTALVKGIKNIPESFVYAFETFGMNDSLLNNNFICLDVANGYLQPFLDQIKKAREWYPSSIIMAGNVVTPEGVEKIVEAGADIVKVGLGSGSACTTRHKTGVGIPQLTAVRECSLAARSLDAHTCSDGGHRSPGDVVKSFAVGADFVMLGGMLAGTNETGNVLYGNASKQAQGEMAKYRTDEGCKLEVEYKGTLDEVIRDLLGGLRSACTYVGALSLKEFEDKAQLIRV